MEAQSLATLGLGGPPCWADAQRIIYGSGNGLVCHDVATGSQIHLWGSGNKTLGGSAGVPVYAVCAARQLVAVAYNGADASIHLVSAHDFHTQATIKEPCKDASWHSLALSADGSRLLGVGSYPEHWMDVWDMDTVIQPQRNQFSTAPAASGGANVASMARMRLGPRLATHTPVFFPLNPGVMAVAGPTAARVLVIEKLLGAQRLHQADVDLGALSEGEIVSCLSWSATGSLLLGTSSGRLLGVTGAAPAAVKEQGWGLGPAALVAVELWAPPNESVTLNHPAAGRPPRPARLTIEGEVDPGTPDGNRTALGAVVSVFCLASHVVLVYAGGGADDGTSGAAYMLWLSASTLKASALCALPGNGRAAHACISPSMDCILIATEAKDLVQASSMFTAPVNPNPSPNPTVNPSMDCRVEDDAMQHDQDGHGLDPGAAVASGMGRWRAASGPTVTARVLASFHAGRTGSVVMLPNEMFATGGEDGRVRLWQCTLGVTDSGGLVPQAADTPEGPRFALGVTLVASWQLGSPVTYMCGFMGGPLVMAGTASGEVHVLNSAKVHVLVGSGSLIELPNVDMGMGQETAAASNVVAAEVEEAMVHVWSQRPFLQPVSAIAVSADGQLCAMSSAAQGVVAFYRVVSISHGSCELALHLLGFYALTCPNLLAWAPRDPSAPPGQSPLLVVSTTNGELQVLRPPDSLGHLKQAGATVPPGDLLVGLLRASSIVTAMATAQATATGLPAEEGTFWLFTCCLDKSVRRIRLPTEQHKMTARAAVGAAMQRQESARAGGAPRRLSYTSGTAPPPTCITAPQNFQTSETEKPLDLSSPACHASLSPSSRHMTVSTVCGTTYVYALPELTQAVRWPMHAPLPVEETALGAPQAVYSASARGLLLPAPPPGPALVHVRAGAAALSTRLLVSVGAEGCVQVAEVALEDGRPRAKQVPMGGRASPSSNLRRAYGSLAPSARMAAPPGLGAVVAGAGAAHPRPPYLRVLDAGPVQVLTWQQAQVAMQAHTIAQELKAAHDKVAKKRAVWQQQLGELRARNQAAGESERLDDQEFVMDLGLQTDLQRQGEQRVAAVRAASVRACVEPEVVRARLSPALLSCTEPGGAHQVLVPLPEHTFVSPVAGEDMKRWKEASSGVALALANGVTSYVVRALDRQEAALLRKVTFLRRVEQEEQRTWPKEARGQAATVKRWRGQMATRVDLSGLVASSNASLEPTPRKDTTAAAVPEPVPDLAAPVATQEEEEEEEEEKGEDGLHKKRVHEDKIEGNEVENGLCGLLYHPLQLHCPTRKAAQATLLMEEVRTVQRAFNARFDKLRARKSADVSKLEERASRVAEIQKELAGLLPPAPDFAGTDREAWQDTLAVQDAEIKVEKWVSAEEALRRAAVARAEEEARIRAEADDARQRALREMMNATLEVKKAAAEDETLKKQPWMDLPRAQLTAEQRLQLTEWEKRSAEVAEEQEKARRALESERKGLEFEMADTIMEFNAQLAALATAKVKVSIELRALEVQALDCALSLEGAAAALGAAERLHGQREAAAGGLEWRRALLAEARHVRHMAAKEYETMAAQERALDKAVKREMGLKDEDMWEAVQRVYKDRVRPPRPGPPGRSLADLLGKLPEASQLVPTTPLSPQGQRRSFTGDLLPHTCTLDPPPPEPPCSTHLTRWLAQHASTDNPDNTTTSSTPQDSAAAVESILKRLVANRAARAGWEQGQQGAEAAATAATTYGLPARAASPATGVRSGAAGMNGTQSPSLRLRPGMARLGAGQTSATGERESLNGAPAGESMLALLLQVLGRPLGPLLDVIVQGRAVRSLLPAITTPSLAPPDTQGLQDPYLSPLAQAVFGPAGPLPSPPSPLPATGSSSQTPTGGSSPLPRRSQEGGHRQSPLLPGPSPYTLSDKPVDMDEVWWLRLMDMRDARIALEQCTDASWSQLAWSSLTCDMLAAEELTNGAELNDINEALAVLPSVASRSLLDVAMLYRLRNGQVEVPCPGDAPLSAMAPAALLHRWQVEQRNMAIQESGGEKLSSLRNLKDLAAASHLGRWEVARAELREQHAKAELSDLQLLHVTKDLQAVLRDRGALSRMDAAAQMEARLAAAHASHGARLAIKVDKEQRITSRVMQCMREHQDLQEATQAARSAADESKRVRAVIARSVADEDAAHKRALRAIVANSQLKDIAAAQATEIQSLMAQLEQLKTRTFPMLSPTMRHQSPASLAPDLRMPRTPSPSASAVPGRPYTVPAGKSRPMYGGTPDRTSTVLLSSRPVSGVPTSMSGSIAASRATSTRPGQTEGLKSATGAASGALPPRPGTVATGNRRYDRPAR